MGKRGAGAVVSTCMQATTLCEASRDVRLALAVESTLRAQLGTQSGAQSGAQLGT